jgi:hypothetical protein
MKAKKIILFFLVLAVCFLGYKGYHWGVQKGIVNANKLFIEVKEPLHKEKLIIINGINSNNDAIITSTYKVADAIYLNGHYKKRPLSNDENDFLFIYAKRYYCYFRYLKYDEIMDDEHNFIVFKQKDDIFVHVIIKPQKINFIIKMSPITNAKYLHYNITTGGDRW